MNQRYFSNEDTSIMSWRILPRCHYDQSGTEYNMLSCHPCLCGFAISFCASYTLQMQWLLIRVAQFLFLLKFPVGIGHFLFETTHLPFPCLIGSIVIWSFWKCMYWPRFLRRHHKCLHVMKGLLIWMLIVCEEYPNVTASSDTITSTLLYLSGMDESAMLRISWLTFGVLRSQVYGAERWIMAIGPIHNWLEFGYVLDSIFHLNNADDPLDFFTWIYLCWQSSFLISFLCDWFTKLRDRLYCLQIRSRTNPNSLVMWYYLSFLDAKTRANNWWHWIPAQTNHVQV